LFFLAGWTETEELKEMTIYPKSTLPCQTPLQCTEIMAGEISHQTATRTNQMMVVLFRLTNNVAMTGGTTMEFADKR
jgi:hypothetical protein